MKDRELEAKVMRFVRELGIALEGKVRTVGFDFTRGMVVISTDGPTYVADAAGFDTHPRLAWPWRRDLTFHKLKLFRRIDLHRSHRWHRVTSVYSDVIRSLEVTRTHRETPCQRPHDRGDATSP